MPGMLRVPRSRGALSGVLLVLLGAWGALIPFVGPYFHYGYSPDRAWTYTSGRLWLDILPGGVAILGGLIALAATTRPAALFGAWLAAMSGAWFVVGQTLSTLWTAGGRQAAGYPVGGTLTRAVEQVGFFTGLGAVVIFFAALSLGRFSVVGVREATRAAKDAAAADQAVADQAAADEAAADRAASERIAADHATVQQPAAERLSTDPAATAEPEPHQRSIPDSHAAP
jgi:hypothetical protein